MSKYNYYEAVHDDIVTAIFDNYSNEQIVTNLRYAHAETIKAGENLKVFIDRYPLADVIHICENATQAYSLAEVWNQVYKNNGTYMY